MSRLQLDRLGKTYGSSVAVDPVSLDIAQSEMVVLLGPSGCGKTTTLRMIAGFVAASTGDILLDGTSILGLPPYKRDLGLVFQSYALFPHLSVARNVAFGLEMRGTPRPALEARVADMLRLTRLEALADRLPKQLSGEQQQRVALARALAIEPRLLLLLDEPLSNLDAALRAEVGRDIRLLQRTSGLTTIMVTHDQDEAMAMADRLVVMKDGRVEQTGTQEDLYERPATPFVAGFIGRSNMVPGILADSVVNADGAALHLAGQYRGAGSCTLALRPERLSLGQAGGCGPGTASGTVELASYLGPVREHLIRVGSTLRILVRDTTARPSPLLAAGEAVTIHWDIGAERVFEATGIPVPGLQTGPTPIRSNHHV